LPIEVGIRMTPLFDYAVERIEAERTKAGRTDARLKNIDADG
jgi:hypothetical protein